MFYIAIFLGGEWGQIDFTWPGKILCCALCVMGIALFAIPVGTVFEAFQDVLQEVHTEEEEEEEEQEVPPKGRWSLFGIQIGKLSVFINSIILKIVERYVSVFHRGEQSEF